MKSFEGVSEDEGVLIGVEDGYEVRNLGFHVYREAGASASG